MSVCAHNRIAALCPLCPTEAALRARASEASPTTKTECARTLGQPQAGTAGTFENDRTMTWFERLKSAGIGADWFDVYAEYLASPEWDERRRLVLERAGGICEGCRRARATQVHHTTYKHAGDELLFELVAVCNACHERLHPHMTATFEERWKEAGR